MGLFDRLTDTLLENRGKDDPRSEFIAPLITIIEKQEGLAGLVDIFLKHERDANIQPWQASASSGSQEDIENTFGKAFLDEYASQLGIAPAEAVDRLAANVPRYIDELVAKGEWPAASNMLDTAMEVLKTKTIN